MSERENGTHREPRFSGHVVADITIEERNYNRSLKIRYGVLAFLTKIARQTDDPPHWETVELLAGMAANFVKKAKWDQKPASSVTATRWVNQYFLPNGPFQKLPTGSGHFVVAFRSPRDARDVARELREFRPPRRKA